MQWILFFLNTAQSHSFQATFYTKNCRLQWDTNSDHWRRRQAWKPLGRHQHGQQHNVLDYIKIVCQNIFRMNSSKKTNHLTYLSRIKKTCLIDLLESLHCWLQCIDKLVNGSGTAAPREDDRIVFRGIDGVSEKWVHRLALMTLRV